MLFNSRLVHNYVKYCTSSLQRPGKFIKRANDEQLFHVTLHYTPQLHVKKHMTFILQRTSDGKKVGMMQNVT
jgi:hypothetical protein